MGRADRAGPDGSGVHTWPGGSSVAGQLCGEGEGAAAAASRVGTKYTSAHTPAVSQPHGPVASSVNQQPEAVRRPSPHPAELPGSHSHGG